MKPVHHRVRRFTVLKSVPIPYPVDNIDTDAIMPKQFLKTIQRSGLGKAIFYERRHCGGDAHGPAGSFAPSLQDNLCAHSSR